MSPAGSASVIILLLVIATAFLLLALTLGVGIYDEGIILVGTMRVAYGEIPHRDFYTLYGPANFYVLASLFKLISPSILVARLWDTVIRALVATFIFLIVDKCGARREAYFAYGASLIWLGFFAHYLYPIFPALLFTLISAFFLLHLFQGTPRVLLLIASGASIGFVTLFRYELGFGVYVTECLVMGSYVLSLKNSKRETFVVLMCILLPYSLGFAVVLVPIAVAYLIYIPISDFVFDLVSFPSENYVKMRSLPFPTGRQLVSSPAQIAIYLPAGVWIAALIMMFREKAGRPPRQQLMEGRFAHWTLILLGALSITFYLKGIVRVSIIHLGPSIILVLALLAVVAKYRLTNDGLSKAVVWLCIFIASMPTLSAAHTVQGRLRHNIKELSRSSMWKAHPTEQQVITSSCRPPSGLARIACFRLDKELINAIQFLQQQTQTNDVIFSGLVRHDKIFINDVMLYFLANRQPVTKWHQFDPGLQTTAPIQQEMVLEFESKKPRFIVLEQIDLLDEPNASGLSSGVTILDDYIRRKYELVRQYGTIYVLARRE
jgi:hypothetical protein